MAAKNTQTEAEPAAAKKKPATRRATTRRPAAPVISPEITEEMIAERAYHLYLSGGGRTDEENWHRAEAELRRGA
jgi:hypothetical protein